MNISLATFLDDLRTLLHLPRVTLRLMASRAENNDPFYRKLIDDFYARTRHRRLRYLGLRDFQWGVALQPMDPPPGAPATLESSAVRNQKKALRNGYRFEKINYNDWLGDIQAVRRSTEVRQGPVDPRLLSKPVRPISDPPSRNLFHDYPFFGVLQGDKLVAYAGCLVAGEVALIEHILGHADHQEQGIMPLLILGMQAEIRKRYPQVRWFGYEMWFGASESLRRFKKKMGFRPYQVNWIKDS